MARPIWTGSITFGLVNVPVKLFSATSAKEVSFHMLHDKDGGRIRQKRVCSVDDEEVPYEHIVKGYEVSRGQYVEVNPEELKKFIPEATKTIDIQEFVELVEIDPIFYDHTYYLVPDKGAGKAYALLLQAMRDSGKVGIAKVVLRTKEYLCAVRPLEDALAMSTMLFADEVVSPKELEGLPGESHHPKGKELEMAKTLVESLAAKFEPEKYKDEYRDQVLELIHKKAEGQEIVAPEERAEQPKVLDLMAALEASLKHSKKKSAGEAEVHDHPAKHKAAGDKGELRHRAHAAKTTRPPAHKKSAKK
jgi:DNA end-binding protein Ku